MRIFLLRGPWREIYFMLSIVTAICFTCLWLKLHFLKRKRKIELEILKQKEPEWDKDFLENYIADSFFRIMAAKEAKDLDSLKLYIHPHLYPEWEKDIRYDQKNSIQTYDEDVRLMDSFLVDIENFDDNSEDRFTVFIRYYSLTEYHQKKKVLGIYDGIYYQLWTFQRHGKAWGLRKVSSIKGLKKIWTKALKSPK